MNDHYISLTNGGFSIPVYPPCRGLWGKVFGHKFQPRYSEKNVGRVPRQAAIVLAQRCVRTEVRRSIEALAGHEKTHTHDLCVRCGLMVPAPET